MDVNKYNHFPLGSVLCPASSQTFLHRFFFNIPTSNSQGQNKLSKYPKNSFVKGKYVDVYLNI